MNTVPRLTKALASLRLEPTDIVLVDARRIQIRSLQHVPPEVCGSGVAICVQCEPGESPATAMVRMSREDAIRALKQIIDGPNPAS